MSLPPAVDNVMFAIGNTPLVRLTKVCKNKKAKIYAKLEFMNPSGSIKDRIVMRMIEDLERQGKLQPGGIIVENSSGNTAAAVAMAAAAKGYKAIIVVPAKCSKEKQAAVVAFGADLVVTPPGAAPGSPLHYEAVAIRIADSIPGAVRLDQYNNELNIDAHYSSTGEEIWQQLDGKVDVFVCGASTGGTISGVGRCLKERSNGACKIVLCDPEGSCLYNAVKEGKYEKHGKTTQIEGIGKNYEVKCHQLSVVDDAIKLNDAKVFEMGRILATQEGILAGGSGSANVYAAVQLGEACEEETTIVTVLPDGGQKYFSKQYNPEWLKQFNLIDEKTAAPFPKSYGVEKFFAEHPLIINA